VARSYDRLVALILLAEDDEGIRVPARAGARFARVTRSRRSPTAGALAAAIGGEHDLLVLDVGCRESDGFELCRACANCTRRFPSSS